MSPISRAALRMSVLIGLTTAVAAPTSLFLASQMNLESPITALTINAATTCVTMLCISMLTPFKRFLR